MALTDEQLEIISDALLPLFQYLEEQVIIDVAKRIKESLAYTRTAELEAQSMQRLGYSPARIRKEAMRILKADAEFRKAVAKNTLEHKKTVRNILRQITRAAGALKSKVLSDAADLSHLSDLRIWKQGGKELTDKSFLPQLVDAIGQQTAETFDNLTGTTGFKTMSGFEAVESLYRKELDKAMIKVCTGTFSREQVVYEVVHSLADSGLRTIDFSSGKSMQLDTAVKLAMRTGAHQLAARITDSNIKQSGVNLVYVSKHWGARNTGTGHANHEQWQGKVYFIKDGTDYSEEARRIGQDRIMSLWYATGYSADGSKANDPLGLNGYNCRHNHYPWFMGTSSLPHEDPEPEPVTINGKTYDYYAITQKQRAKERKIRALKREREALKALDMDTKPISNKIQQKINDYEDFCDKAKVKPAINRLRYESGTSDLTKTEAWQDFEKAAAVKKEYRIIDSGGIADQIERKNVLKKALAVLPPKAKEKLKDATFHLNNDKGSGYSWKDKAIYISSKATKREIIHEVGHHLEFALFDREKVMQLKKELVQGLTRDDILIRTAIDSAGNKANIFTLKSDKFINEYQSRLYVDNLEDALNKDGSINIDVMGEVVSVAIEHYFSYPKTTEKHFREMYDFVKKELYG